MAAGLSAGAHVWVCIARQDGRSKQAGRQAESLAYLGTGSRAVPSPPPKACMAMGLVVVKPLRCRKRLGTVSRS